MSEDTQEIKELVYLALNIPLVRAELGCRKLSDAPPWVHNLRGQQKIQLSRNLYFSIKFKNQS